MTDITDYQYPLTKEPVDGPGNESSKYAGLDPPPCGGCTVTLTAQDGGITGDKVLGRDGQYTSDPDVCQDNRLRANPHSFSVCSATRCNGAPLATIIEQGSVSSLRSQDLPRSGRNFPIIRAGENMSPGRAIIRTFDGKVSKDFGEKSASGDDKPLKLYISDSQTGECFSETGLLGVVAGSTSFARREHCQLGVLQPAVKKQVPEDTSAGCTRGTVQHIKYGPFSFPFPAPSRARSRSRSLSTAGALEDVHDSHITEKSLIIDDPSQPSVLQKSKLQENRAGPEKQPVSASIKPTGRSTSLLLSAEAPSHARIRECLDMTPEPFAEVYEPRMRAVLPSDSQNVDACPPSLTLSFPNLSDFRYGCEAAGGMHPVHPKPCRMTPVDVPAKIATLGQGEFMARTVESYPSSSLLEVSALCSNGSVQTNSKNASFCSTLSTSYSGTVLGIDLDLGHDIEQAARLAESPVWFTPIEDLDTSPYVSSRSEYCMPKTNTTSEHSITSPALSALLPIAAAEGIVRCNIQTPRISFYSPSGNLIEEYAGTPLPRRRSRPKPWPPSATMNCHTSIPGPSNDHNSLTATADSWLSKTAAAPITTPPQMSASRPYRPLYPHNYQQVESFRNTVGSTTAQTGMPTRACVDPAVKGCGGMVSGTRVGTQHYTVTSADGTGSECPVPSFSRSEAARSRFHRFPIWHHSQRRKPSQRAGNGLGVATGRMMRVCFCRPYDGVGGKGQEMACGGLSDGCHDEQSRRAACESRTPNARIVDVVPGKRLGNQAKWNRLPRRSDSGFRAGCELG